MSGKKRVGSLVFFGIIVLIGLAFVGSLVSAWMSSDDLKPGRVVEERTPDGPLHPVTIRQSGIKPLVSTGEVDAHGAPVMVACATCHDNREPDFTTVSGTSLSEFHKGLAYDHGDQTCLSCHNADDYNTLRRADGRSLELHQSMELCAQCHVSQHRDYQDGLHGGMTGYWDLTRGGRQRNSCIDCHDAHHPKFPTLTPVFPPKPVPGEDPHASHSHKKSPKP